MLIALLALLTQPGVQTEAPGIVAALTHETVEIREDFTGMELVLYGATQGLTIRDEIVVTLRGPDQDLRVMRKTRNFGIWMNSAPVEFDSVPAYYAIASSLPIEDIADDDELTRDQIGLTQFLTVRNSETAPENVGDYRNAVLRLANADGLYAFAPRGVEILDGGLFRATLALPPTTPVGNYVADVYLFRDGRPIAHRSSSLRVEKAGFGRWVYEFAQGQSILYGLMCVILAVLAGYLASVIFARR